MESSYRSFSSMNTQLPRDYSPAVRPIITSELIEYSSLISTLQLFLNLDPFFRKLCEVTPPPTKFSGKIKKMLMNFKSDNYTGVSTIVPQPLRLQDQKPAFILNKILEDFKSCPEIPADKGPDSLFPVFGSGFTLQIPLTKLLSTHLSELLNFYIPQVSTGLIAIDIVYDQFPTTEKVLNLLGNLTSFKNFEVAGLITAHGYHYMSYLKSMEQWRSFNEGKMYSWSNLVWNICTGTAYPVMLVLSNNILKNSPCFLSKVEMDAMLKFCKLQDTRVKIAFREDVQENLDETLTRVVIERKTEQPLKDSGLDYVRRSQELINLTEFKKGMMLEREKGLTPVKAEKKEDLYEYRRVVQESRAATEAKTGSLTERGRNYSTEPYAARVPLSRSYKEDLLYNKPTRNFSIGLKENAPKSGILKNSATESRFVKASVNPPSSPFTSPRDPSLSRTLREHNSEKCDDEEVTEKPSSILRNAWMAEKKEPVEKKVNFSDSVFQIDNSIKGQMPEIKMAAMKFTEKNFSRTPEYKAQVSEPKLLVPYKPLDFTQPKLDPKDVWNCPKCSTSIVNSLYECGNCRFINWDRFYTLKSKMNKGRAESIPVKNKEKEDVVKGLRPSYFESRPVGGSWRSSGNEIKVQETYVNDEHSRKANRDFKYNRFAWTAMLKLLRRKTS